MLVIFRLGVGEYAAPIDQVLEIIRVPELTRMPRAPRFVAGLMNLRGKVFPVIDLKSRFRMPEAPLGASARVMVVEVEEQVMGLVVDEVREVLRVPAIGFEPAPAVIAASVGHYLRGVVNDQGRLLLLLDLDRLFTMDETAELARGAAAPGDGTGEG